MNDTFDAYLLDTDPEDLSFEIAEVLHMLGHIEDAALPVTADDDEMIDGFEI